MWPASAVILLSCFAAGLTRRLRACARGPQKRQGKVPWGRQCCARGAHDRGCTGLGGAHVGGSGTTAVFLVLAPPLQQACVDNAMRAPAYVSFPHGAWDMRGRNTFTNTPLPTATRCTTHIWEKPRSRSFGGVGFGGLGRGPLPLLVGEAEPRCELASLYVTGARPMPLCAPCHRRR